MNQKNGQLNISNNIDNIIVKLLLPITKSLLIKTKELEEKKNYNFYSLSSIEILLTISFNPFSISFMSLFITFN